MSRYETNSLFTTDDYSYFSRKRRILERKPFRKETLLCVSCGLEGVRDQAFTVSYTRSKRNLQEEVVLRKHSNKRGRTVNSMCMHMLNFRWMLVKLSPRPFQVFTFVPRVIHDTFISSGLPGAPVVFCFPILLCSCPVWFMHQNRTQKFFGVFLHMSFFVTEHRVPVNTTSIQWSWFSVLY